MDDPVKWLQERNQQVEFKIFRAGQSVKVIVPLDWSQARVEDLKGNVIRSLSNNEPDRLPPS